MALTKLNFGGNQQALVAANIPTLTSNKMPAGSLLQIVQAVKTDKFTNSSSYYSKVNTISNSSLFI